MRVWAVTATWEAGIPLEIERRTEHIIRVSARSAYRHLLESWEEELRSSTKPAPDWPHNGRSGRWCDTDSGPCSCGAWH